MVLQQKFGKYSGKESWNYICMLVDLFNREILGYSAGKNKVAGLVGKAFSRININSEKYRYFTQIEETSLRTEHWIKRLRHST